MSALRNKFVAYAQATPTIDGHTWNQFCALGMSRFQNFLGGWITRPSRFGDYAIDVAHASGTLNKNYAAAPIGAYHWWSVGRAGHVGIDLDGGGSAVGMMGSAKLLTKYHDYIGISSVAYYGTATYMGWSTNYAGGVGYRPVENVRPANARQIRSNPAKRRKQPTIIGDNYNPADNFPGGTWVEWDGFVRSNLPGGSDGDNIWLKKGDLYTKWTTTVPIPGAGALAGIPDLGTYAPPVVTPPVVIPDPPVVVPEPPVVIPEPPVIVPEPPVEPEPVPEVPEVPTEPETPVQPLPEAPETPSLLTKILNALAAILKSIFGVK